MNVIDDLRQRGLIQDITPGTEELLASQSVPFYIGFDPTADSLHIGNLVPVTLMMHLQKAGHKPIVLVGGATGRVGDPSGKTAERQMLDVAQIERNLQAQKNQLSRFLDFDPATPNHAVIVNNYDWFKDISFLDFIRDVGKHITVNYMMAKDSVKNRLETGMSFTEFTYQLIQGYDFLHLHREYGCMLQAGGSDQWGNITTGKELVRRITGGEVQAFTAPLLMKADGTKFGKSEGGNVWLDSGKTSAYKFYQYWLNLADEDAIRVVKIFSFQSIEALDAAIAEHQQAPHLRKIQKLIAEELTTRIHGEEALTKAIDASEMLFGQSTKQALAGLDIQTFEDVFEGVPKSKVALSQLHEGLSIVSALADFGFIKSNSEARRALKEGSISVNREKVIDEATVLLANDLIGDRYILLQRGKKNYFILEVTA